MCYALKENSSFMFFFWLIAQKRAKEVVVLFVSLFFFFVGWGGGGFLLAPDLIPFFIRVILHPMKNGFFTISKEKKMKMKNEFVDRRRGPFNKRKEEALEPPIRILERYLRSDRFQSRHFTSSLLKNVVIVNNLRLKKLKKKEQHVASHDRISLQRTHKRRAHTFGRQGNEGARESRNF